MSISTRDTINGHANNQILYIDQDTHDLLSSPNAAPSMSKTSGKVDIVPVVDPNKSLTQSSLCEDTDRDSGTLIFMHNVRFIRRPIYLFDWLSGKL